jgi:predicted O-methyltransferase YrrM
MAIAEPAKSTSFEGGTRASPQAALLGVADRRAAPLTRLRLWMLARLAARNERAAEARLRANGELWALLDRTAAGNTVTGVSYSDYAALYDHVRKYRPREILECGTGLSTVVLAQALRENEREGDARGRVTSMEDDRFWLENAVGRFPDELRPYVDFVHSPKVDGIYKCFRGVKYAEVPPRPYDFVFSDGPERHSPVNGDKLFNLDLLEVIRQSATPVRAIVDDHFLTSWVLQKVLGTGKARYSAVRRLLFVGPVTSDDVGYLERDNFIADLRLVRPTEFRLRLTRRSASR